MKTHTKVDLFTFLFTWTLLKIVYAKNVTIYPFPEDYIRLKCLDGGANTTFSTRQPGNVCTWKFSLETEAGSTQPDVETKAECEIVREPTRQNGSHPFVIYEGYVKIPAKAKTVSCEGDASNEQKLQVQVAEIASPLISDTSEKPTIVLQRFSNDFGARLGTHDVTGRNVTIDGKLVDSFKLLCVYRRPVIWTTITDQKARILKELSLRDKMWLKTNAEKTEKLWEEYMKSKLEMDMDSSGTFYVRAMGTRVVYTTVIAVQNITNTSSRHYECSNEHKNVTSFVNLQIENPKYIGPDEILVIQQILEILDNLASGKGGGKEPWYTLASVMSIVLILFMYYCKKKLDNSQGESSKPTNKPPNTEETELTVQLRPKPTNAEDIPSGDNHATQPAASASNTSVGV